MKSERDESLEFLPQWTDQGLIPAIAQDVDTKDILMMAWMNEEALQATLESGYAHYWSRSRKALWKKGERSGNIQELIEIRVDCDQDTLLLLVKQSGPACHTNRLSCFYRSLKTLKKLQFLDIGQ